MYNPMQDEQTHTCIAITGMACRFPGARNTAEFWQNLLEGKEAVSFFSDEELLASGASSYWTDWVTEQARKSA